MSLKANPPEHSTCKATIIGVQLLYNVVYMCASEAVALGYRADLTRA